MSKGHGRILDLPVNIGTASTVGVRSISALIKPLKETFRKPAGLSCRGVRGYWCEFQCERRGKVEKETESGEMAGDAEFQIGPFPKLVAECAFQRLQPLLRFRVRSGETV